jgi:hypothetical protein
MFKNIRTHLVVILALACAGPVLAQQAADPSAHQIYEQVEAGHLDQAQQMVNQVLRDHPNNAKAHYVAAEVYARRGDFPAARDQLSKAEGIDPSKSFAPAEALGKLQAELNGGRAMQMQPRFAPSQGTVRSAIPWGFVLVVVAVIAILWAIMRRRTATAVYQSYPGGVAAPAGGPVYGPGPGYGPGYGPGGGGIGSGIAGGLASGLAVGAGVVAGEELAHHFLDRDGNPVPAPVPEQRPDNPNGDMGGNDFGLSDGNAGWDDGSSGGGGDFGGGGGGGGDDWT